MYEVPSPRRVGPGLIAVLVVVAAVAGTMAYLVTRQALADRNAARQTTPPVGQTGGPTGPTQSLPAPPPDTPTGTPTRTRGPEQSRPGDGESCPKLTADALAAAGLNAELSLLMYVEFVTVAGPSRAWICRNADDVLVYQGHQRSSEFDAADNGINTILLAEGIKGTVVEIDGGYQATNRGPGGGLFRYTATEETFTIAPPSGPETTVEVDKVITPG